MCLYKCMYMCVCVCKIYICGLYVHGVFSSYYSCPLTVLKSLFSHSQSRSNCAHQCRLWVYVCSCSHSLIPSIHSFVPVSIFSLTTIPLLLYIVFVCIIHSLCVLYVVFVYMCEVHSTPLSLIFLSYLSCDCQVMQRSRELSFHQEVQFCNAFMEFLTEWVQGEILFTCDHCTHEENLHRWDEWN